MAKVSIVVPVYNVEKYLTSCLESLTHQSLRDIEIICVNDGSTDGSLEIVEKFAKRDKRIVVVNQENAGISAARNAGMKKVTSPYVMFCDSDDKYDKNMCKKMVEAMEGFEVDLVVCGIATEYEAHSEFRESDETYYRLNYSGKVFIDDNVIMKTDASACNKIFRMNLIKKNDILFPEKLKNEDYYFYNAYMSVSKTAYYINRKMYRYVRHEGSIMSDNFNNNLYSPDHLLIAKKLFAFYKKNDYLEQHTDLFWTQFVESFWFSYNHSAKKYRKKIHSIAKDFINKEYDKNEPKSRKVMNAVTVVLKCNVFYRIRKKLKRMAKNLYMKINFAYRQQNYINAHLEELYEQFADLSDRLDNLTKEK